MFLEEVVASGSRRPADSRQGVALVGQQACEARIPRLRSLPDFLQYRQGRRL